MYKSNKDVPPSVLSALQLYYKKQSDFYYRAPVNPKYLVRFNDIDPDSNFFFEITTFNVDTNGNITFGVSHKPQVHSVDTKALTIDNRSMEEHFNLWVNNVSSYTSLFGPADSDFILKQYQDEFYTDFKLVDEDASTTSIDNEKQVLLDKYLDKVIILLEKAKTDTNKTEIEEVKQNVIELKTNQTKLTKQIVVKCISKIWAKARKIGLPVLKLVKEEAIKELVKEGFKMGIDVGIKYLTIV